MNIMSQPECLFFLFFYVVPKFETSIFPALWRPWDCCSKFIALNTMKAMRLTRQVCCFEPTDFYCKAHYFIFVMDFASKSRIFMSPQVLQWKRFVRFEWQVNWCFNKGDLLSLVYQIPRSRKGWGWWLIFSSAKANKLVWFRVLVSNKEEEQAIIVFLLRNLYVIFVNWLKTPIFCLKQGRDREEEGRKERARDWLKQTYKIILETYPNKVVKKGISVQGVEASTKFRCKLPIKTQDSSSARFNRAS